MSTASSPSLPRPHMARLLVFVPPKDGSYTTAGGLHVVAGQSEAPLEGHVLGVGPLVLCPPNGVHALIQQHDKVLFSRYAGITTTIGKHEYHIIEESDVQLVWPGPHPLPDVLAADLPCTCIAKGGRPCASTACANKDVQGLEAEPSALVDDVLGSTELVAP